MAQQRMIAEGEIIAENVSFEEYMEQYAERFAEWVDGKVIKMAPVTEDHDERSQFLVLLLREYLDETDVGILRMAPFVMKIKPGVPGREPDLQIILKARAAILQPTLVAGAADVVIEIVSQDSRYRDLVEKFEEYQAGGVREYWLINPLRKHADFYRLGDDGLYKRIELQDGVFRSTVLPRFSFKVDVLWQEPLPKVPQIHEMVAAMLKEG